MENQNSRESDITSVKAAIDAIAADNAKPARQMRGLMRIPEYADSLPLFDALWKRFYGPLRSFEEEKKCRGCQFERLRKLLAKLSN